MATPPRDAPKITSHWTKLSQRELEEILDKHELFALSRQGGQRAKLTLCDLSYLDLSGRNLKQAEMTGALLCHANLAGTILEEANLFAADMRFADLRNADLTRADIRGVAKANLRRTGSWGATISAPPKRSCVAWKNGSGSSWPW